MDDAAISARGLIKSFGANRVLTGVDLTVAPGTLLALLGPNGSGKTTTVRILTTLLPADAGAARVAGHDVRREGAAVRRSIGLTAQHATVDELLTGRENLELFAGLHHLRGSEGRRRAAELLERFELAAAAHRRVGTYSGGCAADSTWPPAWSPRPGSCSWTSRPRAWTRAAEPSCGR
jgi:ABC-2 type transport system ATP-binding protein